MAIDVVLTRGKHFQLECHCRFVLVNFFWFVIEKNIFQLQKIHCNYFVTFNYVL